MAAALEPLLYRAQVDAVFSGHVHSYERTARMYGGRVRGGGRPASAVGLARQAGRAAPGGGGGDKCCWWRPGGARGCSCQEGREGCSW
jgi:hypothetical protein